MEKIKLNNGIEMPMLGIGTFMLTPEQAENSVYNALKAGYRLIDTANAYVNEKGVGRGIKKSGIAREEIFLETKLWPAFYEEEDQVERTLKRLDTDYIDLLLIHQPTGNYMKAYTIMEKANIDIFDFELTNEEMQEIAKINKNRRYYQSTPELLESYVQMKPDLDAQK